MRILVTGGAGYVGTELVNLLAEETQVAEVVVYDNLSKGNYNLFLGERPKSHDKIKFVKGELLDSRSLKKHLEGIDVVYHLAAKVTTPFASADPHFYEQVNHWGTAELVYAVEESDVKKFIFTSSTSVYGSSNVMATESTPPNPRTFYGISKLRGEEHVNRLMDRMETYVLRCGNVYGYSRSMRFDAVINKFTFEANFDRRISIHGDGKQSRSFIHIDLVSQALKQTLDIKVPSGTYNLVDRNLEILDIVDVLKTIIPELEFLFVNQHLKLRTLNIDPQSGFKQYIPLENHHTLEEELRYFINKFSF